jgi:hypothetical protein
VRKIRIYAVLQASPLTCVRWVEHGIGRLDARADGLTSGRVSSIGNGTGTAIAIGGVLLYSFVKRYERQQKEKIAVAQ